jgi:hypothetical protein
MNVPQTLATSPFLCIYSQMSVQLHTKKWKELMEEIMRQKCQSTRCSLGELGDPMGMTLQVNKLTIYLYFLCCN